MEKQQTVSARLMKRKIGKRLQVMIDEPGGGPSGARGQGPHQGRCAADRRHGLRPSRRPLRAGDIVTVKIERADAYDLYGAAV